MYVNIRMHVEMSVAFATTNDNGVQQICIWQFTTCCNHMVLHTVQNNCNGIIYNYVGLRFHCIASLLCCCV